MRLYSESASGNLILFKQLSEEDGFVTSYTDSDVFACGSTTVVWTNQGPTNGERLADTRVSWEWRQREAAVCCKKKMVASKEVDIDAVIWELGPSLFLYNHIQDFIPYYLCVSVCLCVCVCVLSLWGQPKNVRELQQMSPKAELEPPEPTHLLHK